jgi:hypothetical protein
MRIFHHGELYSKDQYDEIENFFLGDSARWTFTGGSTSQSKKFWYHNLDNEPFFSETSANLIRDRVENCGELLRVYANGQTFEQNGDWHIDEPKIDGGTTVLWYLNDFEENWGGRTLFRHDGGLLEYIIPKKNNFISFPSKLLHMGEAPNSNFNNLRITIAWKFFE